MSSSSWSPAALELRPRRRLLLRREELQDDSARKLVLSIAALALVWQVVHAIAEGRMTGLLAPLAGVGVFLGIAMVISRRMRLSVDGAEIVRTGGLPTRRVLRRDVIGVVRVPIETYGVQEGEVDVLVTPQGRALLRLSCRLWERDALDRAWAQTGLGIQLVPQTMTWKELGDWIPGSTRLYERRPFAFALLTVTGLTLAMIATIAAAALLHH